jgi:hypothetical protein
MTYRIACLASISLLILATLPPTAEAGRIIGSAPVSHPNGLASVVCNVANVGTKDIVISSIDIDDLYKSIDYGNSRGGDCFGSPPWTIAAGAGCTAMLLVPSACNQPDACRCTVEFSGSSKSVRGSLIATVNGSSAVLTEPLR